MAITFDTLKGNATIFSKLSADPIWWSRFKTDDSLYAEIRKDNQVNVYFEGGSIARIHFCSKHKKLQVFTNYKYFGMTDSKSLYVECADYMAENVDNVLDRVKTDYALKDTTPREKWTEKYISGQVILNSKDIHIDSEFAYKDSESDIKVDLVNVVDGVITFVELKALDDSRMLKKDAHNKAEVTLQMEGYYRFISKYKDEILDYYQRVYDIKQQLGLPVPLKRPVRVNLVPELLLFNRWEKENPARIKHKENVEQILLQNKIPYKIID